MDARTKLCCLIGSPVAHSLSPLIHNTLAVRMGINMAYTAFDVDSGKVGDAVFGARAMKFWGLNVTVPHKCTVMDYLTEIDPLAEAIGAVNTLVPAENGFKGYNTDIIGLKRELTEENVEIKGKNVIILGAGGASNAITYLCADMGAEHIWLLNRSIEKAEALANRVNDKFGNIVEAMALGDYHNIPEGRYPVIQTTSVGLLPDTDAAPIEDDDFYKLVSAGVDIIFNPAETRFMKKCNEAGAPAYNGLKMLLYQGIASFELWNRVTVPQELADEVLGLLKKRAWILMNYILIGFMGCGKSSIGRFMAKKGYRLIDTDTYIEQKEKRSVREIFDRDGEEYFRTLETKTMTELAAMKCDGHVIAVGGGLPMREENRRYMHEIGTVVYLRATVDTLEKRLSGDKSRPLLKGGNVRDKIQKLMSERAATYEGTADIAVDTDNLSYEEIFRVIKEKTHL